MNWIARLQNVDRRIIYVVLLILVSYPLINPIGVPLSVSDQTRKFFEIVDELQPGDRVLISLDYSPSSAPDIHPQAVVVLDHIMQKGAKVVTVSFGAPGAHIGEQLLQPYEEQGKVYGVDFVNLGFIAGGEPAISRFGRDIVGTARTDHRGFSTASHPLMAGIVDARDFTFVIDFYGQNPGMQEWVRQVQGPLNIKLLGGSVTVTVPECMPFIQSGQLTALLAGLRGAAEYELLLEQPGLAASKMDAQSLGHLAIIAFILLGNVAYLVAKRQEQDQ